MFPEIERILVSEDEIAKAIDDLAERLKEDYAEGDLVLVAVLNGSVVFLADLIRKLPLKLTFDVIAASSYGSGTTSSGNVKILKELSLDVEGRDVLLIDDIFDTGLTLSALIHYLKEKNPRSLKSCVLLNKQNPERQSDNHPDYWCLDIENEFVVGYGLDYDSRYRNLPYIGVMSGEAGA
ncbi:MAG: hypoxanthine phosphoribosyltransferase [Planctomycetota bacterium]|jgi:hypoxanthine phosphoribosyltransferase|nr:hypoxanthine phosphoribosyltransferase [Planctomycetota bacterium]MDP7253423.1 hypoxanthine phosphoribosyltransferase [Planctomycetota bacterium]